LHTFFADRHHSRAARLKKHLIANARVLRSEIQFTFVFSSSSTTVQHTQCLFDSMQDRIAAQSQQEAVLLPHTFKSGEAAAMSHASCHHATTSDEASFRGPESSLSRRCSLPSLRPASVGLPCCFPGSTKMTAPVVVMRLGLDVHGFVDPCLAAETKPAVC
jgi:hypothetical protein